MRLTCWVNPFIVRPSSLCHCCFLSCPSKEPVMTNATTAPAAHGVSPHHDAPPCAAPLPPQTPTPHPSRPPPRREGHSVVALFRSGILQLQRTCASVTDAAQTRGS